MKRNLLFGSTLLVIIICVLSNISMAQNGSLDLTFGTDGIVTTPVGSSNDRGRSVAIQSDGKILVAGRSEDGNNYGFSLVRYNSDGSIDNTFDSDGRVITQVGVSDAWANSLAIQSDGKIIVAGWCNNYSTIGFSTDFALVRYNPNGSLDNTFDTDGIVYTDISTATDEAYSIAIQSDGKILVAGNTPYVLSGFFGEIFALVRYNLDGSLDATFDGDGIVTTDLGYNQNSTAYSIAIQNDGKILIGGTSDENFGLVRYNSNGSLDSTFSGDGIVTTSINNNNTHHAFSIAIQNDGKILVAGDTNFSSSQVIFSLVRYNSDGSLDNSFDNDGKVTTPFVTNPTSSTTSSAKSIVIQSDGKILAAGSTNVGTTYDFAIVRYNIDGSLDNTFDSDGIVITHLAGDDFGYSVAIQNDDKIIVAGETYNGIERDFAIVRYNNIISGLDNYSIKNNDLIVYPNPFSLETIFQTDMIFESASLILYNSIGQVVKEIQNINSSTFILDRDNLQSGVYFFRLTCKNEILFSNKLFVLD